MDYNVTIQKFPSNLSYFYLGTDFFEVDNEEARKPVKVTFNRIKEPA